MNLNLEQLIAWLESQNPDLVVKDGFSTPHSDRGNYYDLAFTPEPEARVGDMLAHARSAIGSTYHGWKGGEFKMHLSTGVHIGGYGDCGESITSTTLRYWELVGTIPALDSEA